MYTFLHVVFLIVKVVILLFCCILITNSTDDTTIQYINDVMLMEGSRDNILTTVENITLQSDMRYIIQVSFSNENLTLLVVLYNVRKFNDHVVYII